jgi:hypothetical protein
MAPGSSSTVISGIVVMMSTPITAAPIAAIITSVVAAPVSAPITGMMPSGIEAAPAPIVAPVPRTMPRTVTPTAIIPGIVSPTPVIPGIVPGIITPAPTITYIYIETHIGSSARIIRFIIISIISVTQIQVYLIRSDYGYFTWRMITNDAFGIFRVRTPFGLCNDSIFLIRITLFFIIGLFCIRPGVATVIFIHIPVFLPRSIVIGSSNIHHIFFRLYHIFFLYLGILFIFTGREIYIIEELLRRTAKCDKEHQ